MADMWVFGYGSLMWRPGFSFTERQPALMLRAHRSLCIYSVIHRGTWKQPGLVLGLDAGGVCEGVAFRISSDEARQTRSYLRKREQGLNVYQEKTCPIKLLDGSDRTIRAISFFVNRSHPHYAGKLSLERQAYLVRKGKGQSGLNIEYVLNTSQHLQELGIADQRLDRLIPLIGRLKSYPGNLRSKYLD